MYDKLLYESYGYHLDESDADLRNLYRAWTSSPTAENAAAYVAAAARKGETDTATYYAALWSSGDRPDQTTIYTRAKALADAMDRLVLKLQDRGLPFNTALNLLTQMSRSSSRAVSSTDRTWDHYSDSNALAIQSPGRVSQKLMQHMVDYVQGIVDDKGKSLDRVYLGMSLHLKSSISALSRTLEAFKTIAGVVD